MEKKEVSFRPEKEVALGESAFGESPCPVKILDYEWDDETAAQATVVLKIRKEQIGTRDSVYLVLKLKERNVSGTYSFGEIRE